MAVPFASGPRFVVRIWIHDLELDGSVLFLNVWLGFFAGSIPIVCVYGSMNFSPLSGCFAGTFYSIRT